MEKQGWILHKNPKLGWYVRCHLSLQVLIKKKKKKKKGFGIIGFFPFLNWNIVGQGFILKILKQIRVRNVFKPLYKLKAKATRSERFCSEQPSETKLLFA